MRRRLPSSLCLGLAALPAVAHAQPADAQGLPPLPPPPPAPPAEPAPPAVPAAAAPPAVAVVHMDGSDDATLEMASGGGWATVCRPPCDLPLAIGPMYRVAGGVKASRAFGLDGPPRQSLHVRGASPAGFVGGIVAAAVGGGLSAAGFTMGVAGLVFAHEADQPNAVMSASDGDRLATAGWITLGVGVVTGVTGLVLLFSNLQTDVARDLTGAAAATANADGWRFAPDAQSPRAAAARPMLNRVTLIAGVF